MNDHDMTDNDMTAKCGKIEVDKCANQVERRSGLVPPKRDRIVAASTALFIARERFNALGMQAVPNDRDARLQGQIAYDVARAEMNQAQRDLDQLTR